jgi:hypothetical protein
MLVAESAGIVCAVGGYVAAEGVYTVAVELGIPLDAIN